MLILKRERHLIAQHPAKPTSQIAIPQLSQVTQHRAIALPFLLPSFLQNNLSKESARLTHRLDQAVGERYATTIISRVEQSSPARLNGFREFDMIVS